MHLEIPAFGQQKTPIKSGFMRNISFLCSYYGGADGFIDEHLAEVYVSPLKAASISFSGMFSILSGFLLALMIKVK